MRQLPLVGRRKFMVEIYRQDDANAPAGVARALADGLLAILPTETVYGLAADAADPDAVAALYAAKGRPSFNPLIAHVDSVDMAKRCAQFDDTARRLADHFWPGPLTLVLPRAKDAPVCELACAGLDTIALRMPAHPSMRSVIKALGRPVVAPSANQSGKITATILGDALEDLGSHVATAIDAGSCAHGIESTIIDCTAVPARLLRPGALSLEQIEDVIGTLTQADNHYDTQVKAPGMLTSHYAPGKPVRLNALDAGANSAFMDFGGQVPSLEGKVGFYVDLSPNGESQEAAARLFETMRRLDRTDASEIAVAPIPETGLGLAINDRLRRAAAPRDNAVSGAPR